MHTTTITVKLKYNDKDVECIIDAHSTSRKEAEDLSDSHLKAITCLSAFAVATSTLCAATDLDVETVMGIMKSSAKSVMKEVRDVKIVQKPTN